QGGQQSLSGLTPPPPPTTPSYFSQASSPSYAIDPYAPTQANYSSSQGPTPPTPKKRLSPVTTTLLICLALLVIGSGILIYYTGVYEPGRKAGLATATANAQASATAQTTATANAQASAAAQGSATANAQITATANAQVAATASVVASMQQQYDQVVSGTPTLNDPLSGPSANNWDEAAQECTYANGAYHVAIARQRIFLYCTARATNFSNFAYQVSMNILKGDSGGMIFRADINAPHFYLFTFSTNGSYSLYYYPNNKAEDSQPLYRGSSTVFNQGLNQNNTIAVIARGSTLSLYANGKYLAQVSDTHLSGGQIGLVASENTNSTEVVFTQAKVWNL
ncbi:MAG: hypothetical protein J2P37_29020, partial [Ktedonobacteraceae bacterium]|nr:hypothetical protein [Ktedonobacteraceae bacterium]